MSATSTDEALPLGTQKLLYDGDAGDYFALLKPRVMSLVVFTALVGMLVAPGTINPVVGFIAILCIAIGGGASGAINMWYDADIDAVMSRTVNRPIPAGRIEASTALGFGLTLAAFSVVILGLAVNWISAGLLAFTIFFYGVVYTIWLKRSTPQNIVIGGAAGALPPVIGWAAVTGTISIESLILFLVIFLWTPAHFWALALFKRKDYESVGVPMMPNVAGDASTKRQMLVYAILTAISGVLPTLAGFASLAYGALAAVLGAGFVWYSVKVLAMPESDSQMVPAKKMFRYSLIYLAAIFGALLVDSLVSRLMAMVV